MSVKTNSGGVSFAGEAISPQALYSICTVFFGNPGAIITAIENGVNEWLTEPKGLPEAYARGLLRGGPSSPTFPLWPQ
jgi:hypothetical protein